MGALPLDVDVGHEVRTSGRKLTSWFDGGRANDLSGFLFLPIFPRAVHRVHRYHKLAVAIDCLPLAKKLNASHLLWGSKMFALLVSKLANKNLRYLQKYLSTIRDFTVRNWVNTLKGFRI